jgi:hypothetical protein
MPRQLHTAHRTRADTSMIRIMSSSRHCRLVVMREVWLRPIVASSYRGRKNTHTQYYALSGNCFGSSLKDHLMHSQLGTCKAECYAPLFATPNKVELVLLHTCRVDKNTSAVRAPDSHKNKHRHRHKQHLDLHKHKQFHKLHSRVLSAL